MSNNPVCIETSGPVSGTIRPPGSKSITNRALVCAALARGESFLRGALDSEDTQVMIESLRRLGIAIEHDLESESIRVVGCGGHIAPLRTDLFVANSGTTVRFLTALVTLAQGTFRLDGVARMRERPIADLLEALQQLGADARSESGTGAPPVIVHARGLAGGEATVRGDISSQFLSGLMMAAPYAQHDVTLKIQGTLVSTPYVEMTRNVMQQFGVTVDAMAPAGGEIPTRMTRVDIPSSQTYLGRQYDVEPDASAASYFWAAAAITGGRITVRGLSRRSLQGDVEFCDCLEQMGCTVIWQEDAVTVEGGSLHGIDLDMSAMSDTAQTLSVVALFADRPTTIRGIAHNRHKETDRIGDLARELRKLGARVEELSDGMTIDPKPLKGTEIETYNDHRMAMSLALAGLKVPGVVITNPDCTGKTYPRFFEDLMAISAAS